ncbi:DNA-binding response OmpR family regulator [Amorphus sp. MBR-141]
MDCSSVAGPPDSEIEQLRSEVRSLRKCLVASDVTVPSEWGLTRSERTIFLSLLQSEAVSRDGIMTALYSSQESRPEPKILDVFLSRLRKKTKDVGVDIRTDYGFGYRLVDRSKWRARLETSKHEGVT